MRYYEVLESVERMKADASQAKQKKARDRIALANRRRSAAAMRYQDQLKACGDAIDRAKAALHEGSVRAYALRDHRGALFGWIEPVGRVIQGKNKNGTVVGWYDPQQNVTRDRNGTLVGTGDLLSAILVCRS